MSVSFIIVPKGRPSRSLPIADAGPRSAGCSVDVRRRSLCIVPREVLTPGRSFSLKSRHGLCLGGGHSSGQAHTQPSTGTRKPRPHPQIHSPHAHPQTYSLWVERSREEGWLQASPGAPPPGIPQDPSKDRDPQNFRDKRVLGPVGLEPSPGPGGLESHPAPCVSSEEPPLDLTGKVYQLEVMLKQLHTDLQKVRPPGSQPSRCAPPCSFPRRSGSGGPRG